MTNKHCTFAAKNFSRSTLKGLASKGLYIVDMRWLPGADGSYIAADACTGYMLSGGQIRTYLEVLAVAK